jgi:uncharacterized protein (DUF58 family)
MSAASDELFDSAFLAQLERLRVRVRRVFAGSLRAERRSRRTGASLEFADYRNYVPGDDPRRIDWNIYGRIERLMLKLTEEEEDLQVAVLVDASASMRWRPEGATWPGKFTLARRLAAALGYLALHGQDHVEFAFFDETLRGESGFFRGRSALPAVLRFLGQPPPEGGTTNLAESLGRFGKRRGRRGLAIVVTDALDPAGYESGLGALAGRHFDLHLLHLMDPAECEPTARGDFLLRDCEGGGELAVTAGPGLVRAYREEVRRFRDGLQTWCARHNAGYSFVSTADALDDIVLRLFRKDGLLQ